MANKIPAEGHCLCGETRFKAQTINLNVGACHCKMCRTWGGGPLMAVDCGTDVTFENEQNVQIYNSSDWAERGFCKICGSHLFYRLKGVNQYMMPVGLFDDGLGFEFGHQVFIDRKPSFYDFENQTSSMTEAEVFEKYAPKQ